MAKAPAFVLEAGRLRPSPNVITRTRSLQMIDMFIAAFARDDRIHWSGGNRAARSEIVLHPEDRTLRIDIQPPPPPDWVNLQLQAGVDSLACVLMQCDRDYLASDVCDAWHASFNATRNARMRWRFLTTRMQLQVLNSLDAWQPRDVFAIVDVLRYRSGAGILFHLEHLEREVAEALRVLVANGLARPQGEGWVLTREGVEYA